MIIVCHLLKHIRAQIDFDYQHVVINKQCVNTETIALLVVAINSSSIEDNSVKLNHRVEKIHLAESDTNKGQKQQLIKLIY